MKLGKDKQLLLINEQKPMEPADVPLGDHKFPDLDFLELHGVQ
jgi:hypothetical protein